MKKRKKIYRNKKKENKKKLSNIIIGIKVAFVILICSSLFLGFEYFMKINKEFISSTSIGSYIDIVDSSSRAKQQLNWKEVAAIYGAKNGGDLNKIKENNIKDISESFYGEKNSSGKYEVKDFDMVIKENKLSSKEKNQAYKYLEKLKNISIRSKIEGENDIKENFIDSLKEPSIQVYKKYGILPSVAIGQAILESDWGRSELASKYNNYFGIKADKSWKGKVANLETKENHSDIIKANFRAYNSSADSLEDLGKFLTENSRYRNNGLFNGKNYKEQAEILEKAGYSTAENENGDKIYADLLIRIIRENNLMIIDSEV